MSYVKDSTDLSDKVITICCGDGHCKIIYHDGQFDDSITLKDIAEKYPCVRIVIAEFPLRGTVYRYGNHDKGKWEIIGTTEGYA